jgi:hypothetical protein
MNRPYRPDLKNAFSALVNSYNPILKKTPFMNQSTNREKNVKLPEPPLESWSQLNYIYRNTSIKNTKIYIKLLLKFYVKLYRDI